MTPLIEIQMQDGDDDDGDPEEEENIRRPVDRRSSQDPSVEQRIQGAIHMPDITKGLQKRCAATKCKYKSTICCTKCKVYLCLVANRNCFKEYHKK